MGNSKSSAANIVEDRKFGQSAGVFSSAALTDMAYETEMAHAVPLAGYLLVYNEDRFQERWAVLDAEKRTLSSYLKRPTEFVL